MDFTHSTGGPLEGFASEYVRRLLVERFYIYSKLYNPGGSIILRASDIVDHDRPLGYSTEIGNNFHLDLIELEDAFNCLIEDGELTKKEVQSILAWARDLTPRDAAEYMHARGGDASLRKLRSRGVQKLRQRLNGGQGQESRGTSDRDSREGREGQEDDPVQKRDHRSSKKETHKQERDTSVEVRN